MKFSFALSLLEKCGGGVVFFGNAEAFDVGSHFRELGFLCGV